MSAFSINPSSGWNAPVEDIALFTLLPIVNGSSAELRWEAVADAIGYIIYAGSVDEPLQIVGESIGNTFTVSGLASNTVYAFVVVSKLGNRKDTCSKPARNLAPITLSVVNNHNGTQQLNFAFVPGATAYNIYVASSSAGLAPPPIPQTMVIGGPWAQQNSNGFLVSGLSNGPTYYFLVQPVMGKWLGQSSNVYPAPPPPPPPPPPTTFNAYFGFCPTTSPSASDVTTLGSSSLQSSFTGTYALAQSGSTSNYPYIAFPQSFGTPSSFVIGIFQYVLQTTAVTIDGVSYNVFLNPFRTFAPSLTLQVS